MEKWFEIGKEIGLTGIDLTDFIKERESAAREERVQNLELRRNEIAILEMQVRLQEMKQEDNEDDTKDSKDDKGGNARTPKLPFFDEGKDDLDAYLQRFERYATSQKWKVENWATNLSALLRGKALDVYSRLSVEDAADYQCLKKALLKRFRMTEEGFRSKFRSAKPESGETPSQFSVRLENYFTRWLDLAGTEKTFDGVKDILLREQFINSCSRELALFLRERQPKNIQNMTKLAEQYQEAHGIHFGFPVQNRRRPQGTNTTCRQPQLHSTTPTSSLQRYDQHQQPHGKQIYSISEQRTCFICDKKGHVAKDCRYRTPTAKVAAGLTMSSPSQPSKRNWRSERQRNNHGQAQSNQPAKATAVAQPTKENTCERCHQSMPPKETVASVVIANSPLADCCKRDGYVKLDCGHELPVVNAAQTEKSGVRMPTASGLVGPHRVTVLRDSGCSGVVVRRSLVSPNQMTGVWKYCAVLQGQVCKLPTAIIKIDSPYYVGDAEALCMQTPLYDLVIGNIPNARPPFDPDVKWLNEKTSSGPDEHIMQAHAVQTRLQKLKESKPHRQLKTPSSIPDVTPGEIRSSQEVDPSLRKAREMATQEEEKSEKTGRNSRFFFDDGMLFREFYSPRFEQGNHITQLVVPTKYRKHVMKLAHEGILGGHQGARRTTDKVLTNFFWPGINADVMRYCRSCDVCQRTIPKGRVGKVPLGTMPLIETPFQRVAVDIVGPIHPTTEKGNRYIVTVMDYATRYPEAEALPSIETTRVAEALLEIFTRVGFPREILTDQGAQFTSEVMRAISRLLSIRQLKTTPYHPACNRLVERFNGSLKTMLKRMCSERPRDWDRYISPLLFAYREAPQESLGFSPFELLYGRTVRGPMSILQELWTGKADVNSEVKTTYEYVLDLRQRLEDTCQLAQQELTKSTNRHKRYYDSKSRDRSFKVGSKVLLLLPTDHNKLLLQWKGPFTVLERPSRHDYKLDINGKTKMFHANLLKQYIERTEQRDQPSPEVASCSALIIVCTATVDEGEDAVLNDEQSGENIVQDIQIPLPVLEAKESVQDVNINGELTQHQQHEVKRLLGNFSDVLTDLPGRTTLAEHDIKLTTDDSIRSRPYPLPHAMRSTVEDEVKAMLEMGVVEPSDSSYASPIVLVKKKDGTNRFCVDFRQLNRVTVFDAEPMPNADDIFACLSNDVYFTKIDLSKGYWQIPLKQEIKEKSAFITPSGLYQFNVMPFGLVNAPATFTRLMRKLLRDMPSTHNFIDDILVHTPTWEEHIAIVKELMKRLRQANLTARPSKCFIGFEKVEFLGHIVGNGKLQPQPDKLSKVQAAPRPETKKQLRSFLGLAGYYRKFIPNFAAIAVPLTDKTRSTEPNKIRWEESQETAFNTLKRKLTSQPILQLPDVNRPFTLRTDASDTGLGAVLLQEAANEESCKLPVAFASKKLLSREKAYSTTERECLAIVWGIRHFQCYLEGREFILETDHQSLVYLQRAKHLNSRIMRWALSLQPFRFRLESIKGRDNVGADYLSRVGHSA